MSHWLLKILFFLSLLLGFSAHGQELFIIHPHKYYLEEVFSDPRRNSFVEALTSINESFCVKNLNTYWVYDSGDHFFNRKFPIRRCGAKKLHSPWGDISKKKFTLDRTIVLTGLVFNQCVSNSFRSIVNRFVQSQVQNEIDFHFPMPALIAWGNVFDYPTLEIRKILANELMFIKPYRVAENVMKNSPYHLEIYINGTFEKTVSGLANANKKVRMYFWTKTEDMLGAL